MTPHVDLDGTISRPDWPLVERYLAGQITADEQAGVGAWLLSEPEAGATLQQFDSAMKGYAPAIEGEALDHAVALLRGQVNTPRVTHASDRHAGRTLFVNVAQGDTVPNRLGALLVRGLFTAGAAVALVFGIREVRDRLNANPSSPANVKTYVTHAAQRATVQLGDGSSVTLAPSTTLRIRDRDAELNGQAAFTVVPDQRHPFTVRAGSATVRVLGTTFVVRRYASDPHARVVVAMGKVAVGSAVLAAGDQADIAHDGTTALVHGVDIRTDLGWTSGNLVLNKVAFRDAIPELERWYGLTIHADDVLLDWPIRAEFKADAEQQAIDLLAFALKARVIRNGNTITFTSP